MILVIDHYDSFVHNLARYVALAGAATRVISIDGMDIETIAAQAPQAMILSPGPCTPQDARASIELVKKLGRHIPILGVCLGHQIIGEAYGGQTIRSTPYHGRASEIHHDGNGIFDDLPSPFAAGRYHSLVTEISDEIPLSVTARNEDGLMMALQHKTHPVYGVQFHPESILTENGLTLIRNFVKIADQTAKQAA